MKNFRCVCGNTVYFENSQCLACGRALGYLPDRATLSALEPAAADSRGEGQWRAVAPAAGGGDRLYRQCVNYARERVCNWMVPADDPHAFCISCRLNDVIPNLSDPQNRVLWRRIEEAKRRLLYTLYALGLPVIGREVDPERGLGFEFLADQVSGLEFADPFGQHAHVITGHRAGLITINVAEADPSARERMRERMNEQYRTLLGHFRHEIGHYYWERLVRPTACLEAFRTLFGDERGDYEAALAHYHANGAPPDWQVNYVSAYAAAHPWEDWAETWAQYLHIVDTLETAHDYGFELCGRVLAAPIERTEAADAASADSQTRNDVFDELLADWSALSLAMNSLNRSMGLPDAYPFAVSGHAADKVHFVHRLVHYGASDCSAGD
ncbi:MAG: putative zinc-binding peptidase [Gammaproteobacteria bacterium]